MPIPRFPNSNQSNKNLEKLYIWGVVCGCSLLVVVRSYAMRRDIQGSRLWCRDGWNVTKLNITKTWMSPKQKCQIKCLKKWNVPKTEIYTKLKNHQNKNSTKTKILYQNFTKTEKSQNLKCPQNWNFTKTKMSLNWNYNKTKNSEEKIFTKKIISFRLKSYKNLHITKTEILLKIKILSILKLD